MCADIAYHPTAIRNTHRRTGNPRGRPPGRYLLRDGYEATADWIKERLLDVKGPHLVEIREDSGVRLTERNKLTADEFTARAVLPGYVGTYNRVALTEHIEDDLLHWMREQNAEVTRA